jgi:tetratricopeptide (TPR) repeat protein
LVNEWPLAASVLGRAVALDPTSAEAWAWLGEARQHTGLDGLPELDRARDLNPEDALVRALRGMYWQRKGDNAAAVGEYLQAAEIDPKNPALQTALGEAYTAAGNLVASLAAYQRATDLAPADATYWRLLAAFCADNGVQPLEIGLPAAQKAASMQPRDSEVLDTLAWSYAQAGNADKAEQILQDTVRAAPGLALAHLHLAEVYLRKSASTPALEQFKIARDLDAGGPVGQSAAAFIAQYFP